MRDAVAAAPSRLLAAKAAAMYLGVPYTTLRLWAKKGLIPVVRIPGTAALLFERKELDLAVERWKEHAHERWAERLEELKARALERNTQRAGAAAPAIPNRRRGRRQGVSHDRRETPGVAAPTVPGIVPNNGDGAKP
jgi:excisionase family DNA binding protein